MKRSQTKIKLADVDGDGIIDEAEADRLDLDGYAHNCLPSYD
eukprot:SAG11_NODE_1004_length_6210_cov_14.226150_2_plen_42_part_00